MESPFPVHPIYIVCDESKSMEGVAIESINHALPEIHKAIACDPIVNDKVRISVISFSDSAEVLLPLSIMTDVVDFPGLVVKGGTNYGSAFTCLKQTIQDDIIALKAQKDVIVNRPIVFFISGSEPTDANWQAAHNVVADKNWSFSPHIIAFGVGGAQAETIRQVATIVDKSGSFYAYHVNDDTNPGSVLWEILKEIFFYMLGGRRHVDEGGFEFPAHGSGFIKLNE